MGFTISGIAIDKNFSKDIKSLFYLLGIKHFALEKKSTFDEENLEFPEDDSISTAFFEQGTFMSTGAVLMSNDVVLTKASIGRRIVAFYINDNNNTYCFDIFENGKYVRKKWISLTDKAIDSSDNFGEALDEEKVETDDEEIIFKIISSVIGKEFYEIEEDYPMPRYKILNSNVQSERIGFWKRLFG